MGGKFVSLRDIINDDERMVSLHFWYDYDYFFEKGIIFLWKIEISEDFFDFL